MKKIITIVLVLVLALSFAACGSKADSKDAGSGEKASSAEGSKADTSLIDWMKSGTFSYDYTMISESNGEKLETSGSMAIEGNNLAMTSEMNVDGQTIKSHIITKDGTIYIVDDVNKTIMKVQGGMDPTAGTMTDYSGIVKTGDGKGEINGKTLPYEEYTESEQGATVRYYFDGGQVYAIESAFEGYKTVMIITNPKNSVPAGAFDLPEGYTQI